jgi:hypothetical protein
LDDLDELEADDDDEKLFMLKQVFASDDLRLQDKQEDEPQNDYDEISNLSWTELIRIVIKSDSFDFMVDDPIRDICEKLKGLSPNKYNIKVTFDEKVKVTLIVKLY